MHCHKPPHVRQGGHKSAPPRPRRRVRTIAMTSCATWRLSETYSDSLCSIDGLLRRTDSLAHLVDEAIAEHIGRTHLLEQHEQVPVQLLRRLYNDRELTSKHTNIQRRIRAHSKQMRHSHLAAENSKRHLHPTSAYWIGGARMKKSHMALLAEKSATLQSQSAPSRAVSARATWNACWAASASAG